MNIANYLTIRAERIDEKMRTALPAIDATPLKLNQAMHYAVFNGGKRIRPMLVYAAGESFDVPLDLLDGLAAAIEFIHCYSLVHDDLPAMDNSPLRRGKPSCHKAFDEATAILVGDALLTEAFLQITHNQHLEPATQIKMIAILAKACGTQGMVAGQILDLDNIRNTTIAHLERIYQLKTSALIEASILLGALAAPQITAEQIVLLSALGKCLGLAFQIIDDILDVTKPTDTIGKPQGLDLLNEKTTYVTLLGIPAARKCAQAKIDEAYIILENLHLNNNALSQITSYILTRNF